MDYFLTEDQLEMKEIARRIAHEKIKPLSEEYDDFYKGKKLKTWTRVNEETVVYATAFNTLQRFLVSENEFLKFY